MDPFFRARDMRKQGLCTPYVEDIMRTYQNPFTPPARKSETYERAIKFREQEKKQTAELKSNYEILYKAYSDMSSTYDTGLKKNHDLFTELQHMRSQYSKLESELSDVRAATTMANHNGSSNGPVLLHVPNGPATAKQNDDTATDPPEIDKHIDPQPTVPDPSGCADQHGLEG